MQPPFSRHILNWKYIVYLLVSHPICSFCGAVFVHISLPFGAFVCFPPTYSHLYLWRRSGKQLRMHHWALTGATPIAYWQKTSWDPSQWRLCSVHPPCQPSYFYYQKTIPLLCQPLDDNCTCWLPSFHSWNNIKNFYSVSPTYYTRLVSFLVPFTPSLRLSRILYVCGSFVFVFAYAACCMLPAACCLLQLQTRVAVQVGAPIPISLYPIAGLWFPSLF